MLYLSPEQLVELQAQYDFTSKSLGYFKVNLPYYIRQHGHEYVDSVISQLEVEKLKLEVQIDFLRDYMT